MAGESQSERDRATTLDLRLNSRWQKLAALSALTAWTLFYGGMVVRPFAAYYIADDQSSPERLQRAWALEPGNADYPTGLGRYYYRQPKGAGRARARQSYSQALRRNPFNAWCWYQLGFLHLQAGEAEAAEQAIRAAERLSPYSASMALSAAIFRVDQGKPAEAVARLRRALEYDPQSDTEVFELCWDLELDPAAILNQVIPPRPAFLLSYLRFLLHDEQMEAAAEAWQRLIQLPQPFRVDYAFNTVGTYIDLLLQQEMPEQAVVVWQQFLARWPGKRPQDHALNLINNGGFEEDLLNGGLDWRFVASEHAQIRTDDRVAHGGHRSLVITFDGRENLQFQNVYQLVPVAPDTRYHLSGFMRTEGITSDMGPRLEVRDHYDGNRLLRSTEGLVGDNDWRVQDLELTTGPDTRVLAIYIARAPSWKLAHRIEGKVWIDDVRLVRAGS